MSFGVFTPTKASTTQKSRMVKMMAKSLISFLTCKMGEGNQVYLKFIRFSFHTDFRLMIVGAGICSTNSPFTGVCVVNKGSNQNQVMWSGTDWTKSQFESVPEKTYAWFQHWESIKSKRSTNTKWEFHWMNLGLIKLFNCHLDQKMTLPLFSDNGLRFGWNAPHLYTASNAIPEIKTHWSPAVSGLFSFKVNYTKKRFIKHVYIELY